MKRETITCGCKACNGLQAAILPPTAADLASRSPKVRETMVHNLVLMAHGPVARFNPNGPQAV